MINVERVAKLLVVRDQDNSLAAQKDKAIAWSVATSKAQAAINDVLDQLIEIIMNVQCDCGDCDKEVFNNGFRHAKKQIRHRLKAIRGQK